MRRRLSSGSPFETEFAYSRALVAGDWCFVAGTTGYDYATMAMPEAALEQARNALATIARTLEEAGFAMRGHRAGALRDRRRRPSPRDRAGAARGARRRAPGGTMIVAGLIEPEMKVEIEVTAFRG